MLSSPSQGPCQPCSDADKACDELLLHRLLRSMCAHWGGRGKHRCCHMMRWTTLSPSTELFLMISVSWDGHPCLIRTSVQGTGPLVELY